MGLTLPSVPSFLMLGLPKRAFMEVLPRVSPFIASSGSLPQRIYGELQAADPVLIALPRDNTSADGDLISVQHCCKCKPSANQSPQDMMNVPDSGTGLESKPPARLLHARPACIHTPASQCNRGGRGQGG